MIRYTTPTLPMTVPVDITGADIRVSIEQGATRKILKEGTDVTATYNSTAGVTELSVSLTQAETGMLLAGRQAKVQVNWIFANGVRDATLVKTIDISENLLNEVIEYGS